MKKALLISCLLALSLPAYGQTYIKEYITGIWTPGIAVEMYVDEDDNVIDHIFVLRGMDDEYSSADIKRELTILRGTASEIHSFLSSVIAFTDKYSNHQFAGTHINGIKVEKADLIGRSVGIFSPDSGYITVPPKELLRYIQLLERFCDKNNISYNDTGIQEIKLEL